MNSVYPANTTSTSISIFRNRQMPERMDSYWLYVHHGYPLRVSSMVWVTVRLGFEFEFEFGVFCGFYFSLRWQPPRWWHAFIVASTAAPLLLTAKCNAAWPFPLSYPFVSLLLDLPFLCFSCLFLFYSFLLGGSFAVQFPRIR